MANAHYSSFWAPDNNEECYYDNNEECNYFILKYS